MGLSIKSVEAERAVRELAAVTGQSITDAVHGAAVEKLARLGREFRTKAQRRAEVDAWLADLDKRRIPDAPSREEIEAEMYDENGLPI